MHSIRVTCPGRLVYISQTNCLVYETGLTGLKSKVQLNLGLFYVGQASCKTLC